MHLIFARHQQAAVLQGPAVVLHVGNFKPIRGKLLRHGDELFQAIEVHAMNDKIDGEGERKFPDHGNQGQLESVCARAGYVVGSGCILILKTELEMFEPGLDQSGKTIFLQPDARGNHVDVKPGVAGRRDQFNQIRANQRLASREMKMQHTQLPGLPEDSLPVFRG